MSTRVSDVTRSPVRPILHNVESSAAAAEEPSVSVGGGKAEDKETSEHGIRAVKVRRSPKEPTEAEVLAHNPTHVPCRS